MEFLRPKPYASTFFKADGGPSTALSEVPRYKYMFYANFVASSAATSIYPDLKNLGNWENGISFKIHGIDKPRINLTTQELNQYNRRRHVYTKVDYQPFTVKIYDSPDDRPLRLWHRYFTYYFGDSRPKARSNAERELRYNQQVISDKFEYGNGWGLKPEGERLNFFDRVELYAIFGGRYTQINYINPKIESINFQNYETSSSDLAEFDMTMRYEAVEYVGFGKMITPDLENQFGFDFEPALEVPGLLGPDINIISWIPRADIFSMINDIQNGIANLLPTDLMQGISTTFQVANSTLNLFDQGMLGAGPMGTGQIIGQANQAINLANNVANMLDSGAVSGFMDGIQQLPNQISSTLGQFGDFNFGDLGSMAQEALGSINGNEPNYAQNLADGTIAL